MNMFKKLILAALLVPSTLVVGCEAPLQTDTIMGNLSDSVAGFQEGIYKTALAASRFTLSASKGAAVTGNFFADNHLMFGCAATAALVGLGYLYFKRPSRPAWMTMQPYSQMWHNGRQWFSPVAPVA